MIEGNWDGRCGHRRGAVSASGRRGAHTKAMTSKVNPYGDGTARIKILQRIQGDAVLGQH